MTQYVVLYHTGTHQATIALKGYEPTDGAQEAGTFEMDVNQLNSQTHAHELRSPNGDHPFVVKAKEVLENSEAFAGHKMSGVIFLDKASNAAQHTETDLMTTDLDMSEPGTDPDASSQKGGLISTVGTDPATTEPNGKQDIVDSERKDEGEEAPEDSKGETETVQQLKERVAGITDKDELQKVYDDEVAGADRTTAKAAIEARAAELEG